MDQPALPPEHSGMPDETLATLREILAQLRQLNEHVLLSDEQRRYKAREFHEKLSRELVDRAEAAIEAQDFVQAQAAIDELADRLPGNDNVESLRSRLGEARAQTREKDFSAAGERIADMMAVGQFDGAEAEARVLRDRYPADPSAEEKLEHVRRETRLLQDERRDRMYKEVARLAETRRWRQALEAAERFIRAFPEGAPAEAVRAMLPTMRDNARIEEVRELRDRIRDLIERRRYAEALQHARDVIDRFPDTRAAEELGRQIGRLRELAKQSR